MEYSEAMKDAIRYANEQMLLRAKDERPPCMMCKGPNDMAELCKKCGETNDYFGVDVEASGGWMVQDRR